MPLCVARLVVVSDEGLEAAKRIVPALGHEIEVVLEIVERLWVEDTDKSSWKVCERSATVTQGPRNLITHCLKWRPQ